MANSSPAALLVIIGTARILRSRVYATVERLSVCLSHHSPAVRRCCGSLLSARHAEDIDRLLPGIRQQ